MSPRILNELADLTLDLDRDNVKLKRALRSIETTLLDEGHYSYREQFDIILDLVQEALENEETYEPSSD